MHKTRVQKLQNMIRERGWHGFLVTQNVDLYYLSGSMQNGYLFVPLKGDPVFFVRKSAERAKRESVWTVETLVSMRQLQGLLAHHYPSLLAGTEIKVATEFDVLPVQTFQRLQKALSSINWQDGSELLRRLRMIKDDDEIEKIKNAAETLDQAFRHAISHLTVGIRELDLMAQVEYSLRTNGHAGFMRVRGYNQEMTTGIIGSGSAVAEPSYFDGPAGGRGLSASAPQSASYKKIAANEPILIDIGCNVDGYVIDQTRTVVIGQLSNRLQEAYDLTVSILREVEQHLRPGTRCDELHELALARADEAGLTNHFMGFGADRAKFLGHGIGLEIDEWPVLAKGFSLPLEPGMVVAIEPKFTFPGEGVVGIENTYLITEHGFETLTLTDERLWQL